MKRTRTPRLAVTLGDPSGIGPEVTAAALAMPRVRRAMVPVVFGDDAVWARACRSLRVKDALKRVDAVDEADGPALVVVSRLTPEHARPGRPTEVGGHAQLSYLQRAVDALLAGKLDGLTTAPLSKEQVHRTGLPFTGHTEYLAERFGARVLMMLAGPTLRVAVHTTHLALADVPRRLSTAEIVCDIEILDRELRRRFGVKRPRIAVCGLNPHAGEHGLFGEEEERIIAPAVEQAKAHGMRAVGPLPADGVLPLAAAGEYDAVLAMYHDQGTIPVKLLHFDTGVNVTLGLPVPRTSPDHGVAYDLAGKRKARPQSMEAALLLAARMAAGPKS